MFSELKPIEIPRDYETRNPEKWSAGNRCTPIQAASSALRSCAIATFSWEEGSCLPTSRGRTTWYTADLAG